MGKVNFGIYFCVTADVLKTVYRNVSGVVLYQPYEFSKKKKNLLLRSHKLDEAETLHKCS